ncbi:MAG: hypothetical protein V5A23_01240 [Halobacteriales archaeon]
MTRARKQVGSMLADRRRNAALTWLLVAFLGGVAGQSLLSGDFLWAGFVLAVVLLVAAPPVAYRDATVMLPWEVVALAALPIIGRVLASFELTGDLAMYLSVATLALIIAVELHVFTGVRMTFGFAVFFVVVTTMATAGVWAVVRWASDVWMGTTLLYEPGLDEAAVERGVMMEFVYSTAMGLVGGLVFELYFRRRAPLSERVPEEVSDLL